MEEKAIPLQTKVCGVSLPRRMKSWNDWQNRSEFEQTRIDAIQDFVCKLNNQFGFKIFSILGGGSFFRREYRGDSDVDLWIIVHNDSDIVEIDQFCRENMKNIMNIFREVPSVISLQALKRGEHSNKQQNKMGARRFTFLSHQFIRVYGDDLDYDTMPKLTAEQALNGMVKFLKSRIYNFNSSQIAKLFVYVLYYKALVSGHNFTYSFSNMKKIINDANHLLGGICIDFLCGIRNQFPFDFKERINHELLELFS